MTEMSLSRELQETELCLGMNRCPEEENFRDRKGQWSQPATRLSSWLIYSQVLSLLLHPGSTTENVHSIVLYVCLPREILTRDVCAGEGEWRESHGHSMGLWEPVSQSCTKEAINVDAFRGTSAVGHQSLLHKLVLLFHSCQLQCWALRNELHFAAVNTYIFNLAFSGLHFRI